MKKPSWTPEMVEAHERKIRQARGKRTGGQPQPAVRHEPLAEDKVKKENPGKCCVRIVSFRRKLLDIDNLYGGCKYHIDALRYSGLITDDSSKHIHLVVEQVKVSGEENEKTEITIDYPES